MNKIPSCYLRKVTVAILLSSSYVYADANEMPIPDPTPTAPINHAELENRSVKSKEVILHQNRILFRDGRFYPFEQVRRIKPTTERELQMEADSHKEVLKLTGMTIHSELPQLDFPGEPLYFEMPFSESIPECSYASGFTFPDSCIDEHGHSIFKAGKDPQSVLDELMQKHGIISKYNVVPKDYNPDLPSYPYPPEKFPEEELKKLGDEFKKDHPEYVPPPLE